MVRKQLYLEEAQDQALKRRARQLGVSEAELVRQALTIVLREDETAYPPPGDRLDALRNLLADARRLSERHRFSEGYRFNREEVYAERLARWTKPRE